MDLIIAPRFYFMGLEVEVSTIAFPLLVIILPLLAGLIAGRERWLGAGIFVLLPVYPTLAEMSRRWDGYDRHVIHPFDFDTYFMLGLYSVPAFLVGLFGRQIATVISKRG